jgi:hypothetical protein
MPFGLQVIKDGFQSKRIQNVRNVGGKEGMSFLPGMGVVKGRQQPRTLYSSVRHS